MAEWGKGDARWIVSDLGNDGKNVNGWHWEEKSVLGQVRARLEEVFKDLAIDMGGKEGSLTISGVKEVSGEASLNTRKGGRKLIIYDLKVTLDWAGQLAGSSKELKGTIKVEEFSSGLDEDDLVFEATVTGSSGAEQEAAKKAVESLAKPQITSRLMVLAKEMENL